MKDVKDTAPEETAPAEAFVAQPDAQFVAFVAAVLYPHCGAVKASVSLARQLIKEAST